MKTDVLQNLVKRVSQGDTIAAQELCAQIAERLVHIPTIAITHGNGSDTTTKVSIIKIREGNRGLIPVFTTQKLLKEWLKKSDIIGENISLVGADLSLSLSADDWLMIDPGTDYWAELPPHLVKTIAQGSTSESQEQNNQPSTDDVYFEEQKVGTTTDLRAISSNTQTDDEHVRTFGGMFDEKAIDATQEVKIVPNPITRIQDKQKEVQQFFENLTQAELSKSHANIPSLGDIITDEKNESRATVDLTPMRPEE